MAVAIGSAPPDRETKPIGPRIIKLFLIIVGVLCIYFLFYDFVKNIFMGARYSRITNDLNEVAKAIERFQLEKGKPFEESNVDQLQGTILQNLPRDPEGRSYLYDWFYGRLVYLGPDGVLQTLVPGQSSPSEDGESDDVIHPVKVLDRIVYALQEGPVAHVQIGTADGSSLKNLVDTQGQVLSLAGLTAQDANLVAISVKRRDAIEIDILPDISADSPQLETMTKKGSTKDEWPALYAPKNEWIYYQGSPISGKDSNRHDIYRISYKDKIATKLTPGDGDYIQPTAELKNKWIWYSGRPGESGGNYALYRFQLTNYSTPEKVIVLPGSDVKAPAPSPNGNYVAYLVTSSGRTRLEVRDVKGREILFTKDDVWPGSRIVWSPDERKIGYLTQVQGSPRITLSHVMKKITVIPPGLPSTVAFTWLHE